MKSKYGVFALFMYSIYAESTGRSGSVRVFSLICKVCGAGRMLTLDDPVYTLRGV